MCVCVCVCVCVLVHVFVNISVGRGLDDKRVCFIYRPSFLFVATIKGPLPSSRTHPHCVGVPCTKKLIFHVVKIGHETRLQVGVGWSSALDGEMHAESSADSSAASSSVHPQN